MKKFILLFIPFLFFAEVQAGEGNSFTLNAGDTMIGSGTVSHFFTYGAQANFMVSQAWSAGLKFNMYSNLNLSFDHLLASFRYNDKGFFLGADAGLFIVGSHSEFTYGPTIGYYIGQKTKVGVEMDYLLSTQTSGSARIQPLVGLKFMI